MKIKKIAIPIGLALATAIVGGSLFTLINISRDPVQKSLLILPQKHSFYYYKGKQIKLAKRIDLEGVYFITPDVSGSKTKLRANRELFVNFWPETSDEEITSIFEENFLGVVEENKWLGKNYLARTTKSSPFQNAVQMSNYFQETHTTSIEYATPNFETTMFLW